MKPKQILDKIIMEQIKKALNESYSYGQLKQLVDDALEFDGAPDWYQKENPESIQKAKKAEAELIKIGFMDKDGSVDYPDNHPMKKIFDKLADYMDNEYM